MALAPLALSAGKGSAYRELPASPSASLPGWDSPCSRPRRPRAATTRAKTTSCCSPFSPRQERRSGTINASRRAITVPRHRRMARPDRAQRVSSKERRPEMTRVTSASPPGRDLQRRVQTERGHPATAAVAASVSRYAEGRAEILPGPELEWVHEHAHQEPRAERPQRPRLLKPGLPGEQAEMALMQSTSVGTKVKGRCCPSQRSATAHKQLGAGFAANNIG